MVACNALALCVGLVLLSSCMAQEEENVPIPPGTENEGRVFDNTVMTGRERQAVENEEEKEARELANIFNVTDGQPEEIIEDTEGSEDASREDNETMAPPPNDERRKKRSFLTAGAGIWDKCIVPYVWHEKLPESEKTGIGAVLAGFAKWTGFRFVPYTNNSAIGLSHNNYLIFENTGRCKSFVGNLRNKNGQTISACGGGDVAYHEIGHALGMQHEQETPASFKYLDVFFKHIDPSSWGSHIRQNFERVYGHDRMYDISSVMHYTERSLAAEKMRPHDPDMQYLWKMDNTFYMFKTIQEYHKCYDEFPSCATKPTCHRGGYVSVVDGVCACRCPDGLDPATNCQTVKKIAPVTAWPGDKFTVAKVKGFPCPKGFATGNTTHYSNGYVGKGSDFMSPGYGTGLKVSHDVCTQTVGSGSGVWPQGSYCLLRYGGTCPTEFEKGIIETYGGVQITNGSSGTVPDGKHDRLFEYLFCCRNDGSHATPVKLPNTHAFMLWRGKTGCQEVEGMKMISEYFSFKNDLNHGLNRTLNISGSTPYIYKTSEEVHRQYVCAYIPSTSDGCGEVKTFINETSYTFTSPGYPVAYPKLKECWWHFESPVGSTIQLDWNGFEISHSTDTKCGAYVGVRFVAPGMKMFKFCGHNYKKTFTSWSNLLSVKLMTDSSKPWKGFNATVTIIKAEDLCYANDGSDMSYAGKVNYAKGTLNPCLPWNDAKVKKCLFHQFDYRTVDNDLSENNYCRNVGKGTQPWCYTVGETCYRENCDACRSGACYDLSGKCAGWLNANSNFCSKNENGEAHRLCMKTCGQCATKLPAVKDVSCEMPCDINGIGARPQQPSYKVGGVVKYTCPTDEVVRTQTCKGDGTWTNLNFICGACPTGWTYIGAAGRCFKWLGWDVNVGYEDAKRMCAAMSESIPMKVESKFMADFLTDFIEYDKDVQTNVWIGLTADSNRKWHWADGSPLVNFTHWHGGQPNNWANSEDCVASQGITGKWTDVRCTGKNLVVCEKTPTADGDCADQLDNCAAIVVSEPELCIKQYDYAWANCRKTCGIGAKCALPNVKCTDNANLQYRGSRIQGAATVAVGQVVEYKCASEYHNTRGNLLRTCLNTGQLTGTAPICILLDAIDKVALFSDVQLWRRPFGYFYTHYSTIAPSVKDMTISVDGMVTAWTYYSNLVGVAALQVWRPNVDSNTTLKYLLVGQTVLSTVDDARVTVRITDPAAQIHAKVGDLIGVHQVRGAIGFQGCKKAYEPQQAGFLRTISWTDNPSTIAVNTNHQFKADSADCKTYSIHVTLDPSAVCDE